MRILLRLFDYWGRTAKNTIRWSVDAESRIKDEMRRFLMTDEKMATNYGYPIADDDDSLTVGKRGPTLLEQPDDS